MAHEFVAKYGLFSKSDSQVTGSLTVTKGITASLAGTASYSLTSSILNSVVYDIISGSNFTTSIVTAVPLPLSFNIAPNEMWICEAFLTAQCSGNGGIKYAISCSTLGIQKLEGWIIGEANNITSQTCMRFATINTFQSSSIHTTTNLPSPDRIRFSLINGTGSGTVSIAAASNNNGQTTTVFVGSYLKAERINLS